MNYQAAASETEVNNLAVDIYHDLPAASTYNIDTFEFNYLPLNDNDTLQVIIQRISLLLCNWRQYIPQYQTFAKIS